MPNVPESYDYTEPVVGAADGTWGASLNGNWSDLEAALAVIAVALNGCLDLSGGTMTGDAQMLTQSWVLDLIGTGLSGAQPLDVSGSNYFYLSITGNVTISFTNPPASGDVMFVTVEINDTGGNTVSWPSSVKWPGGTPAAQTSGGRDVYTFVTRDGGTSWLGNRVLEDVS